MARLATGAMASILLGAIALSASLLWRESYIAAANGNLVHDMTVADFAAPPDPGPMLPQTAPSRALLSDALWRARAAQRSRDPARRAQLLTEADRNIQTARQAHRWWGDAWLVAAFVATLRSDAPATRTALARSYRDAPYLHSGGGWRVRTGFADWRGYDPATQARMVDEAVWLARENAANYEEVSGFARQSPAYRMFMLGFLAAREEDPDFGPLQHLTP